MRRTAPASPRLVAALALALIGGCRAADQLPGAEPSSPAPAQAAAPSTAMSTVTSTAPVAAPAGDAASPASMAAATAAGEGGARAVSESNDLYEFAYAYPAAAGAIPALKAWLDGDLAKAKTALIRESKADRVEATKNDYPYRAHSSTARWKVVSDLPGWLSLSSQIYVFTGGAHGMTNFDTLLWDKAAGMRRTPLDLFVGKSALRSAIKTPFCAALGRERAKKRGSDYRPGPDDPFSQCIDPVDETTLILGSKGGQRFDRVGFLIGPYAAGPYAEGTYEVTLPLTSALLRAVKPEYRGAFAQP